MKTKERKLLILGIGFIIAFALLTWLIQIIDVQAAGVNGTEIGFATINTWFHSAAGVNMTLYTITDWLGLVPIFICMFFGVVGLIQLIKRKSLWKVDFDIIILGIYYIIVIFGYLIFEMIPINYRPILIDGFMEASYPSSTTLLVLCVMPTLNYQVNNRLKMQAIKNIVSTETDRENFAIRNFCFRENKVKVFKEKFPDKYFVRKDPTTLFYNALSRIYYYPYLLYPYHRYATTLLHQGPNRLPLDSYNILACNLRLSHISLPEYFRNQH